MLDSYNYKTLNEIIGQAVVVEDRKGNQVHLIIAEVNKGQIDGEQWEAFSVIYQGKPDFSVPQGTYKLHHQAFGEKELFLSPNSETEYETVIARRRDAKSDVAVV
ncbi:hypothetical protein [Aliikangiella sp. G2MR2-5]|uniref:DUF6916 family protein n=1 Tax=Aliikangiella sp. G2MR2-5 TaxID=2788943 RepID=UPI0018ABC3A1|nr:hypothetical protein [Aliikangiella sp. G2MR2-5]